MEDIIEYSTNVTMLIEGYSLDALIADKRTYIAVGAWGIVAVIPKYLSLRLLWTKTFTFAST